MANPPLLLRFLVREVLEHCEFGLHALDLVQLVARLNNDTGPFRDFQIATASPVNAKWLEQMEYTHFRKCNWRTSIPIRNALTSTNRPLSTTPSLTTPLFPILILWHGSPSQSFKAQISDRHRLSAVPPNPHRVSAIRGSYTPTDRQTP